MLTQRIAEFVIDTRTSDIPQNVLDASHAVGHAAQTVEASRQQCQRRRKRPPSLAQQ